MSKYLYFVLFLSALLVAGIQFSASAQRIIVPRQLLMATGEDLFPANLTGEDTEPLVNLWDGVDGDNNLCVKVMSSPVLDNIGRMVATPIPSFPNFIDMNGDGLKDIVVADTQGFVWIYLNSGKKGNPKFTTGTFVPTFIGWVSKIHVYDWDNDGDNDILIGTFYGDVVIMKNLGSKQQWRFARKMGVPRYVDPTFGVDDPQDRLPQIFMGKKPLIKGNYLSPWVCDWNKDGKPDLLLGEGTYSANSVRLFVNSGSRTKPVFSEERVFYLAYGEGSEQLTPCVTDYNGDGLNDLIVGTRTGQIRLHKGTKKAIADKDFVAAARGTLAPAILEFDGNLLIGGKEDYDKMSNCYPCDWNDDGLIDLLLGSSKGRINIALNTGTKTDPKFNTVTPVKGTDVLKDRLAPAYWVTSTMRILWQNFLGGFCNTATLLSAEKEIMLKPGYPIKPVAGNYFMYFRYVKKYPGWIRNRLSYAGLLNPNTSVKNIPGGRMILPQPSANKFNLKLNKKYELSFSSILVGQPAIWRFWTMETIEPGTDISAPKYKYQEVSGTITPSSTWVKRKFKFKCPSMVESNRNYKFFFRMPKGECKFLVDNISLKEVRK